MRTATLPALDRPRRDRSRIASKPALLPAGHRQVRSRRRTWRARSPEGVIAGQSTWSPWGSSSSRVEDLHIANPDDRPDAPHGKSSRPHGSANYSSWRPCGATAGNIRGGVCPIRGSVRPIRGSVRPKWGSVSPKWGNVRPIWGSHRPIWGNVRPKWGSRRPKWGSARPKWGNRRPNWGSGRPKWGGSSPKWGGRRPECTSRGNGQETGSGSEILAMAFSSAISSRTGRRRGFIPNSVSCSLVVPYRVFTPERMRP